MHGSTRPPMHISLSIFLLAFFFPPFLSLVPIVRYPLCTFFCPCYIFPGTFLHKGMHHLPSSSRSYYPLYTFFLLRFCLTYDILYSSEHWAVIVQYMVAFRLSFGSTSQVFLVSRWRQVVHDNDDIVHWHRIQELN